MDSMQATLPSSLQDDSERDERDEKSLRAGKNKMLKPVKKDKMLRLSYDKGVE